MIIIYRPADIIEAQLIADQLKARGIESHIGGQYLQGGIGELATMDFITLQVDEADSKPALTIIADFEASQGNSGLKNRATDDDSRQADFRHLLLTLIIVAISIGILVSLAVYYN
jgi:hypothetical protein